MTIGCEQGIVLVRAVSSMLLAVVMEPQAPVGMVRLKMNALAEHLVVPLNALAQAM
jgi:predicted regulator of Ras-like GTPase activity (Roadblock/LC7/MglB family)